MPKPYPSEFREDVVRVARGREAGVTLEQVATDFGVHPMTLHLTSQAHLSPSFILARPLTGTTRTGGCRRLQPQGHDWRVCI